MASTILSLITDHINFLKESKQDQAADQVVINLYSILSIGHHLNWLQVRLQLVLVILLFGDIDTSIHLQELLGALLQVVFYESPLHELIAKSTQDQDADSLNQINISKKSCNLWSRLVTSFTSHESHRSESRSRSYGQTSPCFGLAEGGNRVTILQINVRTLTNLCISLNLTWVNYKKVM